MPTPLSPRPRPVGWRLWSGLLATTLALLSLALTPMHHVWASPLNAPQAQEGAAESGGASAESRKTASERRRKTSSKSRKKSKKSKKSRKKLSAKDRAKRDFKRGSDAFAKEQWGRAVRYFERAYRAYPLPLMMYNIASAYERLGDLPTALERYQAFVATGKDDGDAAARVRVITEQLKSWAELRLSSEPARARVYVESKRAPARGKSPTTLKLPPNQRLTLIVARKGYQDERLTVSLKPKEQRSLKVNLKGKPAFLRVIGAPRDAEVKVDGERVAAGLPITREVRVGAHELEVMAPGFVPQRQRVTLTSQHKRDAPLTIEVNLASSEGVALISINADQEGALIFVDGQPRGQTPLSGPLQLSEGSHLIELKGASGGLFSERIKIKAGESRALQVTLAQGEGWGRARVGLTLASVGGAALISGLISGGLALSSSSDLDACRQDFNCARAQGELNLAQEVRAYAEASDWLMLTGALLGGAGVGLYLMSTPSTPRVTPSVEANPSATPPPAPSASFSVSPLLGGLTATGRFTF